MADSEEAEEGISKPVLLLAVKTTVEGLLASQSPNVWNTYGGLRRLCHSIEKILKHGLKANEATLVGYWSFVRGLRWLNPVLAPAIEKINRFHPSSLEFSQGQLWLEQSLQQHNLAAQLKILVENKSHLYDFYIENAFLCDSYYFQALYVCLQAVEQNNPALLAELSPKLLRNIRVISHARSASLPINSMHRISQDKFAPPVISPKSPCEITTSGEHATRISLGSSPDANGQSAKEALLSVLAKTENGHDTEENGSFLMYNRVQSDPLMNIEFNPSIDPVISSLKHSTGFIQSDLSISTSQIIRRRNKQNNGAKTATKRPADLLRSSSMPATSESRTLQRQASEASMMLDNILNNDDTNAEAVTMSSSGRTRRKSSSKRDNSFKNTNGNKSHSNADKMGGNVNDSKRKKNVSHMRSHSDMTVVKVGHEDNQSDSTLTSMNELASSCPEKSNMRRPSFLEEGGSGIQQATECYFPRPTEGQSLISFLSQQDFNTCAELDKENAHFSICEALIAATELMKWNQVIRPAPVYEEEEDSDDEIRELKQRIRIRRRERLHEKSRGFPAFSDGKTDTATNSTTSPLSSLHESSDFSETSNNNSEDENTIEIEVMRLDSQTNLNMLKESGLSLSMGSMYSEAEIHKTNAAVERHNSITDSNNMSAESVAINLLRKFSERQLPKASDLEWLVSEEDAPQTLLPLPSSFPISPDDSDDKTKRTRLRGNMEWAPPRAQIIFSIHPIPKRTLLMTKQNYRCAGCGTKVEPGFAKRYRYCEYLGKYFCQCCHSNAVAHIPSRVLHKWEFTKYYISNFARDLLEKMHGDPLFNVSDINPSLYRKIKAMDSVKNFRVQLSYLKKFLEMCRNGESLLAEMKKYPSHWLEEPHIYSMADFEKVKNGELQPVLKNLVTDCITHVKQCQLCQAKAFICELCNIENDLLYPWQLNKVSRCPDCHSCFHKSCFIPGKCPKCARVEARRNYLAKTEIFSEENGR